MRAGARAAACTADHHLVIGKMPFSHRLTAYTLTTFLDVGKLSRLNRNFFSSHRMSRFRLNALPIDQMFHSILQYSIQSAARSAHGCFLFLRNIHLVSQPCPSAVM